MGRWINDLKYGCLSENRYIRFDVADYKIKPWMYTILDEYVVGLKKNPETRLQIVGYSDILIAWVRTHTMPPCPKSASIPW